MRLVQEDLTSEVDISERHVSATWMYPQRIYVLTQTGSIYFIDLTKGKTYAILSDMMMEKLMNDHEPIPPNTFLRSYYEGLCKKFRKIELFLYFTRFFLSLLFIYTGKKISEFQFLEKFLPH